MVARCSMLLYLFHRGNDDLLKKKGIQENIYGIIYNSDEG